MIVMPRCLPAPVPRVDYTPEYRAEGALKDAYEDMKRVLQVPWMGVVTMAYAHFPHFFAMFWSGLRELCGSTEFVNAARSLRQDMESAVAKMDPPPIVERLERFGYSAWEIDDIRAVPEILSHGNYLYTLLTTAARYLLEGGEMPSMAAATPFTGRHAPPPRVPLVLMEAHHVDAPTRALYDEVKATLGLPFVNTDYRALARWPSYFATAWPDLRPHVGSAAYDAACEVYQSRAVELVAGLPNPGRISPKVLLEAAAKDNSPDLLPVIQLFQHLHAGLMTNVAFFRHQLLVES